MEKGNLWGRSIDPTLTHAAVKAGHRSIDWSIPSTEDVAPTRLSLRASAVVIIGLVLACWAPILAILFIFMR